MSKSNIFKFDDFDDVRGKIRIFKNIKNFQLKQLNYSESKKHVIRGMHYQKKKFNKQNYIYNAWENFRCFGKYKNKTNLLLFIR